MTDLHASHPDTAETLSALNARFVQHERYDQLFDLAHRLVSLRLADLRSGRVTEGLSLALTAGSGSGKTTAMRHLVRAIQKELSVSDYPQAKIISVSVPSPATLKYVGLRILHALGYELTAARQAWYIWDKVRFHLRENHVLFLHLDEAQDLNTRNSKSELPHVANMLKTISQDDAWPVGFFLSGTEGLKDIINFDAQLGRRIKGIRFEPLKLHSDADDVVGLVESYCAAAGICLGPGAEEDSLGERIIHAGAYEFGLAIRLTLMAIEKALYADVDCLSRDDFATAFEEWKGCGDAFNPFLIPDFTQVDPRKLFGEEGDL